MPGAYDQHLTYVGVHGLGGVALKAEQTGSEDFGTWRRGKNHDTFL